jgi:hypothetical protein
MEIIFQKIYWQVPVRKFGGFVRRFLTSLADMFGKYLEVRGSNMGAPPVGKPKLANPKEPQSSESHWGICFRRFLLNGTNSRMVIRNLPTSIQEPTSRGSCLGGDHLFPYRPQKGGLSLL